MALPATAYTTPAGACGLALGCMVCTSMPRQRSAQPRYRRRVVLELTPDESIVLDRLADRHGTIRGAVLAGLGELDTHRSTELEAQAADLRKRLEQAERDAKAGRQRATADVAAGNEQLA